MTKKRKVTAAMFKNYPDLLTPQQVQKALGVGRTKTYYLLGRGELLSIRIGAKYMIPKQFLVDFLNSSCFLT